MPCVGLERNLDRWPESTERYIAQHLTNRRKYEKNAS